VATNSQETYITGHGVDLRKPTGVAVVVVLGDIVLLSICGRLLNIQLVLAIIRDVNQAIWDRAINIAEVLLSIGMALDLSMACNWITISFVLGSAKYPRSLHTGLDSCSGWLVLDLDIMKLGGDIIRVQTGLILRVLGRSGIAQNGRGVRGLRGGRPTSIIGSMTRSDVGVLQQGGSVTVLGRHGGARC
jgi:hypothetical protein